MDGVALRVMALVRDLLGQHVDHPEQDDEDDRHHDDHDQREHARHLVEHLALEDGGVRGQRREAGEGAERDPPRHVRRLIRVGTECHLHPSATPHSIMNVLARRPQSRLGSRR